MLEFIIGLVQGTPLWVWGILAYLLFVGVQALHTRVVYLPKLFIIPAALLFLNYRHFFSIQAIVGLLIGVYVAKQTHLRVLRSNQSIELPGGYSTLVLLLAIFGFNYYFGYLAATMPNLSSSQLIVRRLGMGLFTGFFIGRTLGYVYRFYKGKESKVMKITN